LQTAEAIRRDGKPDWMQVVGLVHDLGKILVCMGVCDGQWDCVGKSWWLVDKKRGLIGLGDTFVVGCKFSDKIVYPETFKKNPDYYDEKLNTENGIYTPGCGLENVLLR
jgi:inositol oxygenase